MPVHEVTALLAQHLPSYDVRTVTVLGAGLENVAYDVNGELVVRISIAPDAERAALILRETEILRRLAPIATLPIPHPLFVDAAAGAFAYRRLPGTSLLDAPDRADAVDAAEVGAFLACLHTATGMTGIAPRDTFPTSEWLSDAQAQFAQISASMSRHEQRIVEQFLSVAPPPPVDLAREVFSHNDFGAEHLLVNDAGRISGVLDWSDAAMTDPAYDWGLVWRDLGPRLFAGALAEYGPRFDDADISRALFYARCALIEDFAYGIRDGRLRYLTAARAHFAHTFGD